MVFDGYAAGLPVVGTAIPFIRERAERDGATAIIETNDLEAGAMCLCRLDAAREELAVLSWRAREAGEYHSADNWFRRRTEWVMAAVERRRRKAPLSQEAT